MSWLLLAPALFFAWVYSRTDADPDWAYFNLPVFTGSWYGRDTPDCKTPMIWIWYWLIGRVVGANVARIKFTHTLLVSLPGLGYAAITGNVWAGLFYIVLVNSGWLLAFHGNVGQVPAGLIFLALGLGYGLDWICCALVLAAVLFEPKLVLSWVAMVLIRKWYIEAAAFLAAGVIIAAVVRYYWPALFGWVWESSVTIPGRMQKFRRGLYPWMPGFTSTAALHVGPWLAAGAYVIPDWSFWIPALLYLALIATGRVVRPNHLLPLVPWLAYSVGWMPWGVGAALVLVDLVSSGFYLGDIWGRFYSGLVVGMRESKAAGEWLRDKDGRVWVHGLHSEVYLHARRSVPYGLAEQIEIREVAKERREKMLRAWRADPPVWIVITPAPASVEVDLRNYRLANRGQQVQIWRAL